MTAPKNRQRWKAYWVRRLMFFNWRCLLRTSLTYPKCKYTKWVICSYLYWCAFTKNHTNCFGNLCLNAIKYRKNVRVRVIDWFTNNVFRISAKGLMAAILRVWIPRVYSSNKNNTTHSFFIQKSHQYISNEESLEAKFI